ncbi:MAG: site-2 protease family protein, partial [Thermoplasmatota archaeon]
VEVCGDARVFERLARLRLEGEERSLLAALRAVVARHFRVYDAQEDKIRGQVVARRFYVIFPPAEFDRRYDAVRADIKAMDPNLLAFLRRDAGEDILFVAERPPDKPQNVALRVVLLLATVATTTIAGALSWHSFLHGAKGLSWSVLWDPNDLLWGFLSFALPLLLILGIHETAHFVVARRHGLRATLPMFIPAPPFLMPIGTFGAFISLKDPLPDRKALFDVGAAGPIAGFFIAVPVVVLGVFLTSAAALPVPDLDRPLATLDVDGKIVDLAKSETGRANLTLAGPAAGAAVLNLTAPTDRQDGWTFGLHVAVTAANGTVSEETVTATLQPGERILRTVSIPANATMAEVEVTWDDGIMRFGDPLLVQAINLIWPASAGDYLTHPTYIAGWVGLLVTGINLLPTGQLDGGHVSRAVFGERSRWVARLALGMLVVLALLFDTWLLMALFVLFTGIYHPPPLNDRTRLDRKRVVLAAVVLVVFLLTFVPVPFQL